MEATRSTLILSADLHLSYLTWGAGAPVILLHGLADHGLVWQSLAAALANRYLCIAPDLRGHGESSKPPETNYDARLLAADLEALAQHLNLDQVQVVAHSWAAKVALVWAHQRPQRIRSLVLVDPFFVNRLPGLFRPTFPILYRTLPFLKLIGPFPSYEAAVAIAQTLKQYRGWSALQASAFEAGMEQKPDGRWGSKFAVPARNGVFQDTLQRAGLTEEIAIPTCLILPKQGLNRTAFQLKPYRQYLPDLTVVKIPGNHWPHLVEPQAFNQAVADFLGRQLT
ncbi:MAG: alpha/beta hydrolase [Cyanobacteria bacterium P01_G01_bin.38]